MLLLLLLMMDVPSLSDLSRGCVSSHTAVALPFLQTNTIGSSFKFNHSELQIVQCAMSIFGFKTSGCLHAENIPCHIRNKSFYRSKTKILRAHHLSGLQVYISKSSRSFGAARHCLLRLPSAPVRPTLTIVINTTRNLSTELTLRTFHRLSNITTETHNVAIIATNLGALRYA
jgi:hypothetical protein